MVLLGLVAHAIGLDATQGQDAEAQDHHVWLEEKVSPILQEMLSARDKNIMIRNIILKIN